MVDTGKLIHCNVHSQGLKENIYRIQSAEPGADPHGGFKYLDKTKASSYLDTPDSPQANVNVMNSFILFFTWRKRLSI